VTFTPTSTKIELSFITHLSRQTLTSQKKPESDYNLENDQLLSFDRQLSTKKNTCLTKNVDGQNTIGSPTNITSLRPPHGLTKHRVDCFLHLLTFFCGQFWQMPPCGRGCLTFELAAFGKNTRLGEFALGVYSAVI
jgi:hypothetical protein